ncbi:MAG TPA: chitobiase/beta-hexosaminidase C-terminal domain-containing protein, partial [Rubrobacter sp.]|nr:chitobiase/beta-hexosaminidase C-terminal domain-containing protein [Rubrobacter sp.]
MNLSATDTGGSGVKEIRYTTNGTEPTKTTGTVYSVPFTVSGTTMVKYLAVDNAANAEAVKSFQVNIDKIAPAANCGSASANWLGTDASIACSPTDGGGSGLASSVAATFNLSTSVAAGTENANASTDSRTISDAAGNTATAGPIGGNKVDKKAPEVLPTDVTNTTWRNSSLSQNFTSS